MILAALSLAALTSVSLPTSATDPGAQALIDRGLFLYYAYNGRDAEQAFAAAANAEPGLAMAYLGQALAVGPDLNTPMTSENFARGQKAIRRAQALAASTTARERSFIDAMELRYKGTFDDWDGDNAAYRKAMASFATTSGDENAQLLAAEALLENSNTHAALPFITAVLAADPQNPMANHLCIHAYDAAEDRSPALPCAQRLDAASFPPQAEHLAHMPAHYWIETGDYGSAIASSQRAYDLLLELDTLDHRTLGEERYAGHDVSIGYSAAMMLGNYRQAATWAGRMHAIFQRDFAALTALRFGRYGDAFAAGTDASFDLPIRGLAELHDSRLNEALATAALIRKQNGGDPKRGYLPQLFFGRLAEAQGDDRDARVWFTRAQQNQEADFYAEDIPYVPASEALGGYLLRRGEYAKAAAAFNDCLKAYPNDPRALFGLAGALAGEGNAADAAVARERFDALWMSADTTLTIDGL